MAGVLGGYPAATYGFFPYAGLHRQVWLYPVPAEAHIDDVTVATTIRGRRPKMAARFLRSRWAGR